MATLFYLLNQMAASPVLHPVPYFADSAHWYQTLRHLPMPIWLDSGRPHSAYGRYDIIAAAPIRRVETTGEVTRIFQSDGSFQDSAKDPFALIQQQLPAPVTPLGDIPFCGGALGYIGYDIGRRLEKLPSQAVRDIELPDLCMGIYLWAIVQDHQQEQAWLVHLPEAEDLPEIHQIIRFHDLKQNLKIDEFSFEINRFEAEIKAENYARSIRAIQEYIRAGDCYQVNFAQRFSADFSGDPLAAYLALRSALPSPFSGFMELPQGAILSLSPERFIRIDADRRAETQPIKGTIARGADPLSDQMNAATLMNSPKDRAENLMIVDLLRNDLSKHCSTVNVPTLFGLQSFANVHHLVSTITAQLPPEAHAIDILRDCFPGGSITGAPKIRAMEIIEELEPARRSVYCGSLGYISADGQMDTSIAIRTLVCSDGRIHCWGGGGITADSDMEQEYQESITKVRVLMDTLEKHFSRK